MNAIGLMLLGSIAHATAFVLIGTLIYLALRRFSPAAGAFTASSSLLIMAIVSVVVLSPWPAWWRITAPGSAARLPGSDAPVASLDQALLTRENGSSGATNVADARGLARRSEALGPRRAVGLDGVPGRVLSRPCQRPAPEPLDRSGARRPSVSLRVSCLASLCAGFARLGLGVLAVARQRRRSRPLGDAALDEEVQLLRAELSCTKNVEVRESFELESPATLGWRHPLLLLPFDWRDWSRSELRAVLAHELAHVVRGDFLTGLIAQISVSLHFYHPLAHGLARRMRLEQELAADAWGAALSGGSPTYLMTLAQMALRTEDRSLAGPVRAFLPSQCSYHEDRNAEKHPGFFRPDRYRRPLAGHDRTARVARSGRRGRPRANKLRAGTRRDDRAPDRPGSPPRHGGSLDLSLVPAETKLLLALRPAALLENAEIKSLIGSIPQGANPTTSFVVPLEETDQLLIFWEGLPDAASHPGSSAFVPPPSGMVIHSSRPQDWKSRFTKSFESAQDFVMAGQTCFRFAKPLIPGWCGFTPDDKTLVLAGEDTLRDLVADRKGPAPKRAWDEALDKSAKGQIFAALETRWLRRRLAQAAPPGGSQQPSPSGITLETIAPLLDRALGLCCLPRRLARASASIFEPWFLVPTTRNRWPRRCKPCSR